MVFNATFNNAQNKRKIHVQVRVNSIDHYYIDTLIMRYNVFIGSSKFLLDKLKSSLGKFYGHQDDLVNCYGISV